MLSTCEDKEGLMFEVMFVVVGIVGMIIILDLAAHASMKRKG